MDKKTPVRSIILMYHQIIADDVPEGWVPNDLADPRYGVREGIFSEHLALFSRMGLPVIDLDSLLQCNRSDHPLSVVITFDDGYASDLLMASKALLKAGLPATFFLSTARMGQPGMMTKEQAKELASLPNLKIGAHGKTHRFLTDLTDEELGEELFEAKNSIHEWTGEKNIYLSAPGGRVNGNVRKKVMETGYRGLLTSNSGAYINGSDLFSIPRLPITQGTTEQKLQSLLDPDSLSFLLNRCSRILRRVVREVISSPIHQKRNP